MACAGRAAEKSVDIICPADAVFFHLVRVDLVCVVLKFIFKVLSGNISQTHTSQNFFSVYMRNAQVTVDVSHFRMLCIIDE